MRTSPPSQRATAALVLLALTVACASPPRSPSLPVPELDPGVDSWEVVMGLQEGRLVNVGLTPGSAAHATHGEQLRAQMVGADGSSLELRTRGPDSVDGQADLVVTLSRQEVRYLQVPASQDRPRKGGWLGFAIGGGSGAVLGAVGAGAGEPGNFAFLVATLGAAAFGFLGFLIGRGVDRKRTRGDFITIYGSGPAEEEEVASRP